nr:hypothetical protein [Halobellus sp. DFY28]
MPHEKWQERPVAYVVREDQSLDEEALREHLLETFPKWWLPDVFRSVEEIPRRILTSSTRRISVVSSSRRKERFRSTNSVSFSSSILIVNDHPTTL